MSQLQVKCFHEKKTEARTIAEPYGHFHPLSLQGTSRATERASVGHWPAKYESPFSAHSSRRCNHGEKHGDKGEISTADQHGQLMF